MATIVDELFIRLGLDSIGFKQGLNDAVNSVKESSNSLDGAQEQINKSVSSSSGEAISRLDEMKAKTLQASQAMQEAGRKYEQLASGWRASILGLVRSIAAPIAGAFAMGSTINSYFSGVAEVARLTGAYNAKLDEWNKKRAMLARVNREDIELYRKGREALTRFNIVMADLSTGIMRSQMPAMKFLIELLNKFTDWIDRNQPNIIRFLQVVSGVITAYLIPSFIKLGIAMATNPLTWMIAAIGVLVLVIDDLVTYIHGGESAFAGLWGIVGNGQTWLKIINFVFDDLLGMLKQLAPALIAFGSAFAIIKTGTAIVTGITTAFKALQVLLMSNPVGLMVTAAVVALTLLYNNWDKVIAGFKSGVAWFKEKFPTVTQVIEIIIEKLSNLGKKISEIFSFDGIKSKIAGMVDWMPDWLKTDDMKSWAESIKQPQINGQSAQQVISSTASHSSKTQNINNNNNINVYTNTDNPRALGEQLQNAMQQMNNSNAMNVASAESGVR